MSEIYRFADKDNNVLQEEDQISGCWGAFKNLGEAIASTHRSMILAKKDPEHYPESFSNGNHTLMGVLFSEFEKVRYLRVFATTGVASSCRAPLSLYKDCEDRFVSKLPNWFQDFTLHLPKAGDVEVRPYYLVDLKASFFRNYNALRLLRNFLSITNRMTNEGYSGSLNSLTPNQLIVACEVYRSFNEGLREFVRMHLGDAVTFPYNTFTSLEQVLDRLEESPILDIDFDMLSSNKVALTLLNAKFAAQVRWVGSCFYKTTDHRSEGGIAGEYYLPNSLSGFVRLCNTHNQKEQKPCLD